MNSLIIIQYFSNPPIELPTMLLLSNTSHLLRDPKIIKHFAGRQVKFTHFKFKNNITFFKKRVLAHDVESEIANSDGEFFGPVYRLDFVAMHTFPKKERRKTAKILFALLQAGRATEEGERGE